jgi:hypothetical protein
MNDNVRSASALSLRSPLREQAKGRPPIELEKARAEVERARADTAAAQERADQLKAKMLRSSRDAKFRLRATAVIMMTAALLKIGWEAAHASTTPGFGSVQPSAQTAQAMSANSSSNSASASGPANNSEGVKALERLRDAFHSFPDEDQVELVHQINKHNVNGVMTCPLVWHNGVPSLYVGDKTRDTPPYVASSLNHCSEAVEKLRAETDVATRR